MVMRLLGRGMYHIAWATIALSCLYKRAEEQPLGIPQQKEITVSWSLARETIAKANIIAQFLHDYIHPKL